MSSQESEIVVNLRRPPRPPREPSPTTETPPSPTGQSELEPPTSPTSPDANTESEPERPAQQTGNPLLQRFSRVYSGLNPPILRLTVVVLCLPVFLLLILLAIVPVVLILIASLFVVALIFYLVQEQIYFGLLVAQIFVVFGIGAVFKVVGNSVDDDITLSLTTQTMHVKRSGRFASDTILPLDQIISFSSRSYTTTDKNGNPQNRVDSVCVESIGHRIAFGAMRSAPNASSNAYETTVVLLNEFLTQSRQRNASPTPRAPLRDSNQTTFRLTNASPISTVPPSLSQLSFDELNETSFKYVNKRRSPISIMLSLGASFVLWIVSILVSLIFGPITSLSVFINEPFVITGTVLYVVITLVILRVMFVPSTWIFSTQIPWYGARIFLHLFRGIVHIPVNAYNYVEVEKYEGSSKHGFPHNRTRRIKGLLFKVHFIADAGRKQTISGFAEGEVLCLTYWLRSRFPFLLENGIERGGETDDGLLWQESHYLLNQIDMRIGTCFHR